MRLTLHFFRCIGQVSATEDIACGTELAITYIDTREPRSVRRAKLAERYGFQCACRRCTAISDDLM